MRTLTLSATRAWTRRFDDDPERGDVPGWVLVTLMTAGLVLLIWGFAGPALSNIFNDAVARVTGEIGG